MEIEHPKDVRDVGIEHPKDVRDKLCIVCGQPEAAHPDVAGFHKFSRSGDVTPVESTESPADVPAVEGTVVDDGGA